MNAEIQNKQENFQCEKCGRFDAMEIGDKFLCEECITQAGCACAEKEDEN